MKIAGIDVDLQTLPAPVPIARARVTARQWLAAAGAVPAVLAAPPGPYHQQYAAVVHGAT